MSYGSYDNSSPLSQPFNPTGPSAGQDIVDTAARSAVGAVGQQFQGNNGKSSGQIGNGIGFGKSQPGPIGQIFNGVNKVGQAINSDLPGAPPQSAQPPLTPQENVEQSRRSGGILKIRGQQPGQAAQTPGGKGGKSDGPQMMMPGGATVGVGPQMMMPGGRTQEQREYQQSQTNFYNAPDVLRPVDQYYESTK